MKYLYIFFGVIFLFLILFFFVDDGKKVCRFNVILGGVSPIFHIKFDSGQKFEALGYVDVPLKPSNLEHYCIFVYAVPSYDGVYLDDYRFCGYVDSVQQPCLVFVEGNRR